MTSSAARCGLVNAMDMMRRSMPCRFPSDDSVAPFLRMAALMSSG
jgi:hypothetical protein